MVKNCTRSLCNRNPETRQNCGSVARSGGIVLRWSGGYGAGGWILRPGFDPWSRHIFWRPWIFLSPLWPRTPTGFPSQVTLCGFKSQRHSSVSPLLDQSKNLLLDDKEKANVVNDVFINQNTSLDTSLALEAFPFGSSPLQERLTLIVYHQRKLLRLWALELCWLSPHAGVTKSPIACWRRLALPSLVRL